MSGFLTEQTIRETTREMTKEDNVQARSNRLDTSKNDVSLIHLNLVLNQITMV
jgi:hypothetical protein